MSHHYDVEYDLVKEKSRKEKWIVSCDENIATLNTYLEQIAESPNIIKEAISDKLNTWQSYRKKVEKELNSVESLLAQGKLYVGFGEL